MDKPKIVHSRRSHPFATILFSGLLLLTCYIQPSKAECMANIGGGMTPGINCYAANVESGFLSTWNVQATQPYLKVLIDLVAPNSNGWTVTVTDGTIVAELTSEMRPFISQGTSVTVEIGFALSALPPNPNMIHVTAINARGMVDLSTRCKLDYPKPGQWNSDGYTGQGPGNSGSKVFTCSSIPPNLQAGNNLLSFNYMSNTLSEMSGEVSVPCLGTNTPIFPGQLMISCTKPSIRDPSLIVTFLASGQFNIQVSEETIHMISSQPGVPTISKVSSLPTTSPGDASTNDAQSGPSGGVPVPVVVVLIIVVVVLAVIVACFVYRRQRKPPNQTDGPGMALHPMSHLHGRGSAEQHDYEETDDRRGGLNRDSTVYAEIRDRDYSKDGKELPGKNHGKPLGSRPAPPAPRGGARYQDVLAPGGRPVVGALQDSQATSEMHTYEGLQNPDAGYTSLLPDLVLNENKTSKPVSEDRGQVNDVYNEIDEQNYNVLDSGEEVSGYHDENPGRSKPSPNKPRANNINTSGPYQALGKPDAKTSSIDSLAGTNDRDQVVLQENAPTGQSGIDGSGNHAYQDLRQGGDNYTPLRTGDAGSDTHSGNQGFRHDEASPGSDYLGLEKEQPNYAVLESSDPERSEYESPRRDQDSGDYLSPSDSQVSGKDDYAKPMRKPLSTNQSDESKAGAGYTSLQLDNQGPNSADLDPDDNQVPESAKAASPLSTGDEHDDYMDPVQADTRTQSEGPYDHLQHQKMNYVKPSQAHFAGNQSDGSNLDAGYGALILDSQSPGAAVQKPSGSNDNYASLQATGDDHDDYMDPVRETPASEGPYDHLQHQRITS